MDRQSYTVGLAGHIDHGKTELTKALTGIETDRLKEEKARGISIELGFAPLYLDEDIQVAIIDVPGHEKFIRQMIAGAVGIDLAILVVAADEGVMPQTKEHLEILSFLGIANVLIVITKIDKVEEGFLDLVKEDIKKNVAGTSFAKADLYCVDSISGRGISELKGSLAKQLKRIPIRDSSGPFRMAIDQVFTIQGQGKIVRGTISEGKVKETDRVRVMPKNEEIRIRQLQVQHKQVSEAKAGQRVALNVAGISKQALQRGDVLVNSDDFATTSRMDVSLRSVKNLQFPVKQRAPIKVHIGTAIVMGRIIFFDRNDWKVDEELVCQLELVEPVVGKRGDRLIIRRPSPVETIGGGRVINAMAKRHRFGKETIEALQQKKEGSSADQILDVLSEKSALSEKELLRASELSKKAFQEAFQDLIEGNKIVKLANDKGLYVLSVSHAQLKRQALELLIHFHERFPLRAGMDKNKMINGLAAKEVWSEAVLAELGQQGKLKQHGPYLALTEFKPAYPKEWSKRMETAVQQLQIGGIEPEPWEEIVSRNGIPKQWQDELKHYLVWKKIAYKLDENLLIDYVSFRDAVLKLYESSNGAALSLKLAKEVLGLSRKYLIPFLELMDRLKITIRDGNERNWIESTLKQLQR